MWFINEFLTLSLLEEIGDSTFQYCNSLRMADLSHLTSLDTIGRFTFGECEALETILFPPSLTSVGDLAFIQCINLEAIIFSPTLTFVDQFLAGHASSAMTTPDFSPDSKLDTIGENSFRECKSLVMIAFPPSLTSVGSHTFYQCEKLESISFPQSMAFVGDNTFLLCGLITKLDFSPAANPEKIGDCTFQYLPNLETIIFPSKLESIGLATFAVAGQLKSLDFSPIENLQGFGSVTFAQCEMLESIKIGATATMLSFDGDPFVMCNMLTVFECRFDSLFSHNIFHFRQTISAVKFSGLCKARPEDYELVKAIILIPYVTDLYVPCCFVGDDGWELLGKEIHHYSKYGDCSPTDHMTMDDLQQFLPFFILSCFQFIYVLTID